MDLCGEILEIRRQSFGQSQARPCIVWEPMEDACQPDQLGAFCKAAKDVDVFSPNAKELLSLCNSPSSGDDIKISEIRRGCNMLLESSQGGHLKAVIARCGALGCLVAEPDHCRMLPAFHQSNDQRITHAEGTTTSLKLIIDVTGGGNAFLGGLSAGIARDAQEPGFSKFETAAVYGNVAASYAIEQVGPPQMLGNDSENGIESWNGSKPLDRLCELIERSRLSYKGTGRYSI